MFSLWLFCCWCTLAQEVRTGDLYDIVEDKFCRKDMNGGDQTMLPPLARESGSVQSSLSHGSPLQSGSSPSNPAVMNSPSPSRYSNENDAASRYLPVLLEGSSTAHEHRTMQYLGPATPEKYERGVRSNSTRHDRSSSLKRNGSHSNPREMVDPEKAQTGWNWLDHCMDENQSRIIGPPDDEKSDRILEIDPGKPHGNMKLRYSSSARHASNQDRASHSYTTMDSPSKDSTTGQRSDPSTSSGEVQSVSRRKFPREVEDAVFCTAENSPQFYSASSRHGSERRGPFTPAKSDCSRSFLSGYSDYPNYMSNTESFKAKVRSQSAPKQRLEFEKSSSTKKYSNLGFGEFRSSSTQRSSTLHTNFTRKAYPGSARLDRLGMPVRSSHETVVNHNI